MVRARVRSQSDTGSTPDRLHREDWARVIPAAPTGKQVSIRFTNLVTLRAGGIVSSRLYFDTAEMAAQLGLIPSPTAV